MVFIKCLMLLLFFEPMLMDRPPLPKMPLLRTERDLHAKLLSDVAS